MEGFNRVRGIAHDLDVAKITMRGVPDRPGIAAEIFEPLADAHLSVDTIVQNASEEQPHRPHVHGREERPRRRRCRIVQTRSRKTIGARKSSRTSAWAR